MPDQFRNWGADAYRMAHDVLRWPVRPADLQIRGDGDNTVFHAVEQSFQFGASLANGGKVFFQAPRRPVERYGHLANFIAAVLGNSRGKIAGCHLFRKADNPAQASRNI